MTPYVCEHAFDLGNRGKLTLKIAWQALRELVLGHADGLSAAPECVLGYDRVLTFAQDQADGGLVCRVAQKVVYGGQVKSHLSRVVGLELADLEVYDHETAQLEVIEEKVDIKRVAADFKPVVTAHKREAYPKLQQELAQVNHKSFLKLALAGGFFDAQKVESVGVFENLLCQVRLDGGEGLLKVGDGLATPLKELCLYLVH